MSNRTEEQLANRRAKARWRYRTDAKFRQRLLDYSRKRRTELGRAVILEYERKWRDGNRDKTRAAARRWREHNPESARNHTLLTKHKMTKQEYDALFAAQGGVCAICAHTAPAGANLYVDHCHRSDKNRGLLCLHCNTALGHFRDDVGVLAKAIEYINKFNTIFTK